MPRTRLRTRLRADRHDRDVARPSAPRWVRALIWALVVLVVAGGGAATSAAVGPAHFGSDKPVAATTTPSLVAEPADLCRTQPQVCAADAMDLLPVFRWENLPDFQNRNNTDVSLTDVPITGIINSFLVQFATFLMSIANWIWRITIFCIFLGTGNNWLKESTYIISAFVLRIGVLGWIGVAAAWFAVLWRSAKLSLKADLMGILRSLATFLLPVGLFVFVYNGAASVVDAGKTQITGKDGAGCIDASSPQLAFDTSGCDPVSLRNVSVSLAGVPGNPVWLASQVGDQLEGIFGEAAVQVLSAGSNDSLVENALGRVGGGEGAPNCGGYIQALFDRYDQTTSADTKAIAKAVSAKHVSALYRVAAEASWGDSDAVNYVPCQEFEDGNDVPTVDRQATMAVAFPELITSVNPPRTDGTGGGTAAGHPAVYQTIMPGQFDPDIYGDQWSYEPAENVMTNFQREEQLRYYNWFACLWRDGEWTLNWRWIGVGNTSIGAQSDYDDGAMRDAYKAKDFVSDKGKYCTERWNNGHKNIDGQLGAIDPNEIGEATTKHSVDSVEARATIKMWNGERPQPRIVLGLTAIGAAIAYLFMLGGPALGLLATTIGLILLLSAFPITLALMAAKVRAGGQLMRMTIGFIGAKAMFLVLLSLIVTVEMILGAVFASVDTSVNQSGFISSLLQVLTPIAVLIVVNKIMQAAGLGKLTSIKGSLGALGDLSSKAAKSSSLGSFATGGLGRGARKVGKLAAGSKKATAGAIKKFNPNSKLLAEGRRNHRELNRLRALEQAEKAKPEHLRDKGLLASLEKQRGSLESKMKAADLKAQQFKNHFKPRNVAKALGNAGTAAKGAVTKGGLVGGAAMAAGFLGALTPGGIILGAGAAAYAGRKASQAVGNYRKNSMQASAAQLEADRQSAMDEEFARTVPPDELATDPTARQAANRRVADHVARRTQGLTGAGLSAELDRIGKEERRTLTAHLNPDGTPLTDGQLNAVARVKAQEWGVNPSQVLVSSDGVAVLDPATALSSIGNASALGRPELHLDQAELRNLMQNTATGRDRADKLVTALAVAGLYRSDGAQVIVEDVIAAQGIDTSTVSGQQAALELVSDPVRSGVLRVTLNTGNTAIAQVQTALQSSLAADYQQLLTEQIQSEWNLRMDIAPALEAIDSVPQQLLVRVASISNGIAAPMPVSLDLEDLSDWRDAQRHQADALQSTLNEIASLIPQYEEFGGHLAAASSQTYEEGVEIVRGAVRSALDRIETAARSLDTSKPDSVRQVATQVFDALGQLDSAARRVIPIDALKARVNELGHVRRDLGGPARPPQIGPLT